jgi:hypothetical protein
MHAEEGRIQVMWISSLRPLGGGSSGAKQASVAEDSSRGCDTMKDKSVYIATALECINLIKVYTSGFTLETFLAGEGVERGSVHTGNVRKAKPRV